MINRRDFIKSLGLCTTALTVAPNPLFSAELKITKPNVILMMTDDMGYGDTGFNGNSIIKTPHLDQLCRDGIKFTHFYSGAPVCSPTRATCLTGRHYYRYGIWSANQGRLPVQEITIPKILKESGYHTGHFGKWHLGSPNEDFSGKNNKNIAYPEWFDYDEYFVTASSVTLYNPFGVNGKDASSSSNPYWYFKKSDGMDRSVRVTENVSGEDPRIIMDRIIPFIEKSHENSEPFLAVIWFHTPHKTIDTGSVYTALYSEYSESEQKYFGCLTAMDDQIGRLRGKLDELKILNNTMLWFCSDNGPENGTAGSTGGYRGRKRSLYSGGTGVPAFIRWPEFTDNPKFEYKTDENGYRYTDMYASTLDYFPTILDNLLMTMPDDRPVDGVNLMDWLNGEMNERSLPIPFRFTAKKGKMADSPTVATIAQIEGVNYKYLTNFSECGVYDQMYALNTDPGEENDILMDNQWIGDSLRAHCEDFLESFQKSYNGGDYDYETLGTWQSTGGWSDIDPCDGVGIQEYWRQRVPVKTCLNENYPNPFNNSTLIQYSLAKDENVNMSIYNMTGQKVVTLINGCKNAGMHLIKWQVGSIPSGTYFVSLKTSGGIDIKKCLYLK